MTLTNGIILLPDRMMHGNVIIKDGIIDARRGSIAPGKEATIVVFDEQFKVKHIPALD